MEQRAGAAQISIRQVLEADGHLDEPLQRFPLVSGGAHPVGLECLVNFEVETRVEQRGGGGQCRSQRSVGGIERARADGPPRPRRALAKLGGVLRPAALEREPLPVSLEEIDGEGVRVLAAGERPRLDADGGQGLEALPRAGIV